MKVMNGIANMHIYSVLLYYKSLMMFKNDLVMLFILHAQLFRFCDFPVVGFFGIATFRFCDFSVLRCGQSTIILKVCQNEICVYVCLIILLNMI